MHELITRVVVEQPEKIAVRAGDGVLTYGELERESDQLASWLLQQDDLSVRNCMVPICFEKTVWTTVTILAIAKAGGAFVALDADQPQSRLKTIMQDLQATCVLCTSKTIDTVQKSGPENMSH